MKKVLAIVKDQSIERLISQELAGDEYFLFVERSGFDGIIRAKAERPDFIISVCDLPDIDTRELLNELGSLGLLTFAPLILIREEGSMEEHWMEEADVLLPVSAIHTGLTQAFHQAEEAKLHHIDALNQVQHEFNEKYLSHSPAYSAKEMKRKLLIIQKLFPLIKLGRMSLNTGLEILDYPETEMDEKILDANKFINLSNGLTRLKNSEESSVKNIWLIDDDPTQNLLNRVVLKQINPTWKVREFNDAERAFQALSSSKPDLVFLDINMPGMSGFEFLKKLTIHKIILNVIMLSSSVSPHEIKRSLGFEQVINYFTKPIHREKVSKFIISSYF